VTTTVTLGETTITPTLLLGYRSTRRTRNVITPTLDDEATDAVMLRGAGLRTGTLVFLCTEETAFALEQLHTAGVLTLADDEVPAIGMDYVPSGQISVVLDEDTRDDWTVEVEFQEVVS
jgi:hypothetical protein